jgi:hypothetical protein
MEHQSKAPLCGPSTEPSTEGFQVKLNVPLRVRGQADKREFMFVDVQADISQTFGVGKQKKAFLSKKILPKEAASLHTQTQDHRTVFEPRIASRQPS